MNRIAKQLIKKLNLEAHPEGGYFRETYRSMAEISEPALGGAYKGSRNVSTCIYFLLTSEKFSAFHRIKQDEIWHFYSGNSLRLHLISEAGVYSNQLIGSHIFEGEVPQFVVKGGDWFAAEVIQDDGYALVGCTVAPGFSFDDFELANAETLTALFPSHKEIIQQLTHH